MAKLNTKKYYTKIIIDRHIAEEKYQGTIF